MRAVSGLSCASRVETAREEGGVLKSTLAWGSSSAFSPFLGQVYITYDLLAHSRSGLAASVISC